MGAAAAAVAVQTDLWGQPATPNHPAPWELPGNIATPPRAYPAYAPRVVEVVHNPKRWTTNAIRRVIRSTVTNQLASTKACRECGWAVVYSSQWVQVERTRTEASFAGLVQCRNRWLCPVCAARLARDEGEQLRALLVELRRKGGRAYMATLTVPHAMHHEVKQVRETVSKAWRSVSNGKPWKRFCAEYRIAGAARALEVTHGNSGWHPHLHVLFFCNRPLSEGDVTRARAWLSARWSRHVQRLGWKAPHETHGVTFKSSSTDKYISKMGLADELTGSLTKRGRTGRRTPWQIAYDIAKAKMSPPAVRDAAALARDVAIWKAYAAGMRGAKQLTWTRGLRALFTRAPDAEQLELEVADRRGPETEIVLDVPRSIWNDWLRDNVRLQLQVLRAAERGSSARDLRFLIEGPARAEGMLLLWRGKNFPRVAK